jgi:hypothetical protein
MTLDKVLGHLTKTENGKRIVNSIYASEFLTESSGKLAELEESDITTIEGLEAYSTLTGDDPSKYSQEKTEFRKKARLSGGQSDLSGYVNKHFNEIVDELDETTQTRLGFQYCPKNEAEGSHKPYNATTSIVRGHKETIRKIKENPAEYTENEIRNESQEMKHYIIRFTQEFLDIDKREAERNALLTISHYGAGRFLRVTKQHFDTQARGLENKQEEIGKAMDAKIETAEKKTGRILSVAEITSLVSNERKDLEKAFTEYSDYQSLQPFTQNTMGLAIQAIKKQAT